MSHHLTDDLFDLDQVSFSYDQGKSYALRDISLRVRRGATTAILGLSGSGKTTLLNLMAMLSGGSEHEGIIRYGSRHDRASPDESAAVRLHDFGFVLQSAYMLAHFTCGQNVAMPLALQGLDAKEIDRRVTELMQAADPSGRLLRRKDYLARDVAGGERQRMAILRAVIHDPQVVFADEPLASLDPRSSEDILRLLGDWKAGRLRASGRAESIYPPAVRSLILVTHDIDVAWEQADEFAILVGGRLAGNRIWIKSQLGGPQQIKSLMTSQTPPAPSESDPASMRDRIRRLASAGWGALRALPGRLLRRSMRRNPTSYVRSRPQGVRNRFRSVWRSLQFYYWFALQNLIERHAWRSTFINVASIAAVVALVILSFGSTWGVEQARLQELRDDPLNLCLWVGSSVTEPQFDKIRVDDLRQKLVAKVPPDTLLGCFPFSEMEFTWYRRDGGVQRHHGRTLGPDDPMLKSVRLAGGRRTSLSLQEEGVIVTRDMLDSLGYRVGEPPATLGLEPPGGGECKVPVLDVVLDGLPRGGFVISEVYESRLRQQNPNPTLPAITVEPVPGDWKDVTKLPPGVKKLLWDYNLLPPAVERISSGGIRWKLAHNGRDQVPTLAEWETYRKQIYLAMKEAGFTDSPKARITYDAQPLRFPQREKHDFLGIYLSQLHGLTPAAEVCEAEGLAPNKDVIRRLLAIGGQTKAILKRLTVFAFLIGGIVLFYMSLLQFQRNEQKIAEIGMLKAIGMAPKGLLALALAEATVLWLFGAALGIVASILLGPLAAIDQIVAGEPMRIVYSGKLMAVTIALSFLMCILSNIWATRRSRRDPASVSLRAG